MLNLSLILNVLFFNLQFSHAAENQFFEVTESNFQNGVPSRTQVSEMSILRNARPPFVVKLNTDNDISYYKITSKNRDNFFKLIGDYYAQSLGQSPGRMSGPDGSASKILRTHSQFAGSKMDETTVRYFVNTSSYRNMLTNARRSTDHRLIRALRGHSSKGRAGIATGLGVAAGAVVGNLVESNINTPAGSSVDIPIEVEP